MAKNKPKKINLKTSQTELTDGRIQLTITVPASMTGDVLRGATFALAMQHKINLQGIKPEELGPKVLDTVGEAQFNAFLDYYTMNALTPFAITEEGIEPIMEPDLNTNMKFAPGKDFTYVATITLKPRYSLSSYDPVSVKIPPIVVTEEEIDTQLYSMAEQAATTEPDESAVVGLNSEIVISISSSFKDSDEVIKHLTAERREYELGKGFLPEDFDRQLIGMKAGESKSFDFDIPGIPGAEGELGESRTATTTVDLIQVSRRVVPAITDTWVKKNMPEAKNVDGLREMIRAQGVDYKTNERENMKFFLVASTFAERFQGTIDDSLYEYTRSDMLANLKEQLKQNDMTLEQYLQSSGMDQQQFGMRLMMDVRESLRQGFALDALARHLKLKLTPEDIDYTLARMAPGNEERARADFEGSGRMYILNEAAMRTKANKWLVDTATYEVEDLV